MTDEQLLDENLAPWLEPSGVQLDNDRIPLYRAAVVEMTSDLGGRAFAMVRAAHSQLDDDVRGWIATAVRTADEGFVGEGKDSLLERLAAATVINVLTTRSDDEAALVCLAVQSAGFLGLSPSVADMSRIAPLALTRLALNRRARPPLRGTAAETVSKLPTARKSDPESGVVITPDELAEDLSIHAKALRALGARVDEMEKANRQTASSLDEEVEILWWLLLERDDNGRVWSQHTPRDRAVLAAAELHVRTLIRPGPPAATHFLTRVLGDDADKTTSIGEIAVAGAQLDAVTSGHDSLLPISSAIAAFRELGGSDGLWQQLAAAKFQVDTTQCATLSTVAEQLHRELTMLKLLAE